MDPQPLLPTRYKGEGGEFSKFSKKLGSDFSHRNGGVGIDIYVDDATLHFKCDQPSDLCFVDQTEVQKPILVVTAPVATTRIGY